jgi:hypothetical protein
MILPREGLSSTVSTMAAMAVQRHPVQSEGKGGSQRWIFDNPPPSPPPKQDGLFFPSLSYLPSLFPSFPLSILPSFHPPLFLPSLSLTTSSSATTSLDRYEGPTDYSGWPDRPSSGEWLQEGGTQGTRQDPSSGEARQEDKERSRCHIETLCHVRAITSF